MPFIAWLIPIAKQIGVWLIPYIVQKKAEEYFEKRKAEQEAKKAEKLSPKEGENV